MEEVKKVKEENGIKTVVLEDDSIVHIHAGGWCPEKNNFAVVEPEIIDYEYEEDVCYPITTQKEFLKILGEDELLKNIGYYNFIRRSDQ